MYGLIGSCEGRVASTICAPCVVVCLTLAQALSQLRYEQLRNLESAEVHARRARELSIEADDARGEAQACNAIGWYLALQGKYSVAIEFCREALTLFQEFDDELYRAHTLDSIGFCLFGLRDYSDAIKHYNEALLTYRKLEDRYYEAETLNHIGESALADQQSELAKSSWRKALELFEEIGHLPRAVDVRAQLGRLSDASDAYA